MLEAVFEIHKKDMALTLSTILIASIALLFSTSSFLAHQKHQLVMRIIAFDTFFQYLEPGL